MVIYEKVNARHRKMAHNTNGVQALYYLAIGLRTNKAK